MDKCLALLFKPSGRLDKRLTLLLEPSGRLFPKLPLLVYEVPESCHNKKSDYAQDQDDDPENPLPPKKVYYLFLLLGALACFLQLLGLSPFGFVEVVSATPNKLTRLRARAENFCGWRIQILLCFTEVHFIQRFIRFALNIFFQLRANPLRVLVSRKPLMVRFLYRLNEAVMGKLVSNCAGAVLSAYDVCILQFFQRQPGNPQRRSTHAAKSESACSGGSYQSCSKPTAQFTFTNPAFTGGSSSLNRPVVIARQSIIHVAEAFDVFGRDQTRSIAAGVRPILPFGGEILPERLADHLKLNRFDEFAAGFTEFVALCYSHFRKLRH